MRFSCKFSRLAIISFCFVFLAFSAISLFVNSLTRVGSYPASISCGSAFSIIDVNAEKPSSFSSSVIAGKSLTNSCKPATSLNSVCISAIAWL